ncbi:MAG: globin [Sphingopyxis sp.]|uniref:globin n=1 Tax=Sphingopyxis sp. TaxID=1908224 RepID=UPI002AB829DA|nr:globin [Sphingopyxis sp.]MDZ3830528.1 globin [Sphingopyxis sp.]
MTDAAAMEANLVAIAAAEIDIRHTLFERFLAAFPHRRDVFLNLDAASRRMTDETLQILYGLAGGEGWVWPLVAELVVTHRNYGALTIAEYDAFIDMTVDAVAAASGDGWDATAEAAWRRQAAALKAMVRRADSEWTAAIAGSSLQGAS